jgi:hypothetical protein
MSGATLIFRRFGQRPPPFIDLVTELELVNSSDVIQWFFLPTYLDPQSPFDELQASSAEIYQLPGSGPVRIARFLGANSFQALRLPPHGRILVHDFPITYMGEPPRRGTVQVPVKRADGWRIGGQTAEEWLPVDVTSAANAEVTEEPGAIIASKENLGGAALPVTLIGASQWTLPLKLEPKG